MSLSHEDVQEILRLLEDTDYEELDLETDRFTLRLKRGEAGWTQEQATKGKSQQVNITSIDSDNAIEEPQPTEEGLLDIRAPMVGTFYRSPSPGSPSFVDVGSRVKVGDTLCIIESMKMMNEVKAEVAGVVEAVLVRNEDAVEFDQPIFTLT